MNNKISNNYQYFDNNKFGLHILRPHNEPLLNVVIFPHAGATSLAYQKLAAQLPTNCKVSVIDTPGHLLTSTSDYATIPLLVNALINTLPNHIFDNAIFFGHSFGGYVAYEAALQLQTRNINPKGLMISCSLPPHVSRPFMSRDVDDDKLIELLVADEQQKENVNKIKNINSEFINILRHDLLLYENYKPLTALSLPARIIGALDDNVCRFDVLYQWRKWLSNSKLEFLHGNHLYIMNMQSNHPKIIIDCLSELGM